jgi:CheY-like chemotaxis protein
MAQILLIDQHPERQTHFALALQGAGHDIRTASSGAQGLAWLARRPVDLAVIDLRLPDSAGAEILHAVRSPAVGRPPIIVTGFVSLRDVVAAVRLGAIDLLDEPVSEHDLLKAVERALAGAGEAPPATGERDASSAPNAHAAARWARALVPVIDSPVDPRTLEGWARCIAVSPSTLRKWCYAAGIGPRRALVFARLLRATTLTARGHYSLEALLDFVHRRTFLGLLKFSGFDLPNVPTDPAEFLERQTLVRDGAALAEIRRLLTVTRPGRVNTVSNVVTTSGAGPS